MGPTIGLTFIGGITLADLPHLNLHTTDTRSPGRAVLAGLDPAAAEVAGGVVIAQGATDIAQEIESYALVLGDRIVAVGVAPADRTYVLTVCDRSGVVRHVVDTMEERTFEVGAPLPQEDGVRRLDGDETLRIFEQLTGIGLGEVMEMELVALRPAQDVDDLEGRSWWQRLFGIHSNKDGYADKPGPPIPN